MLLNKNQEKNREFSIEKIATAIHAENLISSLKNKYIDPLILYKRQVPQNKIKHQRTFSNEDALSLGKLLISNFYKSKADEDKIILNEEKLLPIITPKSNKVKEESIPIKFMVTSGMFKNKNYYKNAFQKLKLRNIMNCKTNDDSINKNLYPKMENINKLNDKYNLNLNLKFLNEEKKKNVNYPPKVLNKKELMKYLINKYIFSPTDININKTENSKNLENINLKQRKSNFDKKKSMTMDELVIDNNINIFDQNKSSNNRDTFITKIKYKTKINDELKENDKIINIKKQPSKQIFSYLFHKNKDIITHDKNIFVDCLYSKVISNIDEKNIIYNPYAKLKTNYAIIKEPSYQKIKKFEMKINRVIKNPRDLTITINK